MSPEVQYWLNQLNLIPHPEGGYFREVYRSADLLNLSDFSGERSVSTAIYYLLPEGSFSAFHRIRSDECWHFYAGESLSIHIIHPNGVFETKIIGNQLNSNLHPFAVVPKNAWFAAKSNGDFSLVGCTVAPGFSFEDYEMAQTKDMILQFPQHQIVIKEFTRG
jgi:predicted cupin superfamily sugar epimerase